MSRSPRPSDASGASSSSAPQRNSRLLPRYTPLSEMLPPRFPSGPYPSSSSTPPTPSAKSLPSESTQAPSAIISSVESIDPTRVSPTAVRTVMDVLAPHAVSLEHMDDSYHVLLVLVKALIGVVSNCYGVMEIFPPAFTTYNLIIPNCINVPFLMWGVAAPPDLIGLATYYSARSAQCAYCSLHTCNFALRRGLDRDALMGSRSFSARESAVVEVALNMSSFPNHLTEDDRRNLFRHLSPANVEWIVLAVSMSGYLTTFMSSLGTDMEQAAVEETADLLKAAGWSQGKHQVTSPETYLQHGELNPTRGDTFMSNIMMLRHLPTAIKYDIAATKKIPSSWPKIGEFLNVNVGHSFPILGLLTHDRAVRALAECIRLNLDAIVCGIEPDTKYLIGIVFAGVNRNRLMAKEFRRMTMMMVDDFDDDMIGAVYDFSKEETDFSVDFLSALTDSALMETTLTETQVRLLYIAKACSFMPTKTTQAVVEATKPLRSEHTVELLSWVSLLSLLQKLYIFYYPSCSESVTLKNAQLGERAPKFTKIVPTFDKVARHLQ
ncbi:unnamed protein product [Agarophyton chilense]|eukprot:gb/GEZJ01001180.1/.p1 GENE.gb/GEZJ01001180.1/~~gb/GEZJ01001180.1/.p1  ORF type:complete len:550 (-),score=77.84 gb/GEZJ01001180.1/:98-1747(-)